MRLPHIIMTTCIASAVALACSGGDGTPSSRTDRQQAADGCNCNECGCPPPSGTNTCLIYGCNHMTGQCGTIPTGYQNDGTACTWYLNCNTGGICMSGTCVATHGYTCTGNGCNTNPNCNCAATQNINGQWTFGCCDNCGNCPPPPGECTLSSY